MSFRVSHRGVYDQMTLVLQRYNTNLAQANYAVATGREVNRPSDDPVAMVSILGSRRNLAALDQYQRNINSADAWLKTTDTALTQADDVLVRARELAEQMSTGTYSAQNRADAAVEIEGLIQNLLGLANTKVGDAQIFAGDRVHTTPFFDTFYVNKVQTNPDNASNYCGLVTAQGTWYHGHSALTPTFNDVGQYQLTATQLESADDQALNYSGYFSFYYDNDADYDGTTTDLDDIYGVARVTSTMTLNDIASMINEGTAARGQLTFSNPVNQGDVIQIGSAFYQFGSSVNDAPVIAGANIISMGSVAGSAQLAISALMLALNADSGADAWAVQGSTLADSNVLTLMAKDLGSAGNTLRVLANADLGQWSASGTTVTDLSTTLIADGQDNTTIFSQTTQILSDAGQFAFWYNDDADANGQEVEDLYGVMDVTDSNTLTEIRDLINNGTAARAELVFTSTAGSNTILSIGNMTFEFTSAAVDSTNFSGSVSHFYQLAMGASTIGAESAVTLIMSAIRAHTEADIIAVQSTAADSSFFVFAKTNGVSGNGLEVRANTSGIELSGDSIDSSVQYLERGGENWATADVVAASHAGQFFGSGYILRIEATSTAGNELSFATAGAGYLTFTSGVTALDGPGVWGTSVSTAVLSFLGGGENWVTADVVSGASGYQLQLTGVSGNTVASTTHRIYLGGTSGALPAFSGAGLSMFASTYDQISEWTSGGAPVLYLFADEAGSTYNSMSLEFRGTAQPNQPLTVQVNDTAVVVTLATDNTGTYTTTVGDVMRAIEAEPAAAKLIDAELPDGVLSTTLVSPASAAYFSGGQTSLSRRYTVEITTGGAVGADRAAWLDTGLSGADNDLTITAVSGGSWGNNIRVRYVAGVPGTASTTLTTVVVSGDYDITVNLATSTDGTITATASQVMVALNLSAAAILSASVSPGNSTGAAEVLEMDWAVLSEGAGQARFKIIEYADGTSTEGRDDTYLVDSDMTQIYDELNSRYNGIQVAFTENGTTLQQGDQFHIDVGYYRGDEADLKVNIGYNDTIAKNVTGTEMMGGAGDTDNILDIMRQFVDYLKANDQHGCQETLVKLEEARKGLVTEQTANGAAINRVEIKTTVNESFALTAQELLDETEGVDLSELIMELNMMQTAYQASLASISRISSLSLVDYL